MVVTPQRVADAPPVVFERRNGPITRVVGRGYRGVAQNVPGSQTEAGLAQADAQVISGGVIVRLLVTYHGPGLDGAPQLPQTVTLARRIGRRLATAH